MTRPEVSNVELQDQINNAINKVSLATMAIHGWNREGARPEGVSGLVNLLDEAHDDLLFVVGSLTLSSKRREEPKPVENDAA